MPTYVIKAPNGQDVEMTGDHYPTKDEQAQVFKAAGVDVMSAVRRQQMSPFGMARRDAPDQIETFMQTPLARPTGVEWIDDLTSPANLALTAYMGAGPAKALVGKAVTSLSDSLGAEKAGKLLKFIAKRIPGVGGASDAVDLLKHLGGEGEATAAASAPAAGAPAVSTPAAAPVTASPSAAATGAKVLSHFEEGLIQSLPAEQQAAVRAEALQSGKSVQAILNDQAIQARRAAAGGAGGSSPAGKSAPVAPPRETPPTAAASPSPRPRLTGAETKMFYDQLRRGKSYEQAYQAVSDARELAQKLGGASPEEVRKAVRHRNQTGKW